jgi:hypothetical protein
MAMLLRLGCRSKGVGISQWLAAMTVVILLFVEACRSDTEPCPEPGTGDAGNTGGSGGAGDSGGSGGGASLCGNGKVGAGEICDGDDLGTATCATAVAPGWVGSLACAPTCDVLDTSECEAPKTKYQELTNPALWEMYDVAGQFSGAKGFIGGAFDGRYVYLVPRQIGTETTVV